MLYKVTHTTRYIYESPVSYCINEARLMPRGLPNQQVRQTTIRVDPTPGFFSHRTDYFGNEVDSFGVFEKHDRFAATANSIVEVRPLAPAASTMAWEAVRDMVETDPGAECLEASEFVQDSPFIPTSVGLADYARRSFQPQRPLVDAVAELSHRIHVEFKYQPNSTSIDMPLREVLEKRRGVCQDFAHVMIGSLRSLRLAARYVSGYLRPGPRVQGAQASHAWVSVYVPGSGWLDLDPTNDMCPSKLDTHITVAWGRDYGDVTPIKGVTLGGGRQAVEVEVYVKSVDNPL